jgi:hypothetical protein
MFQDDKELPPGQTDEIGRRMAEVIDEQEEQAVQHIDPHWELFYDEEKDDAEQIVHLHGDERVPARLTAHSDGSSWADCSQCGEKLDISKASRPRRKAKEPASAG